MVKRLLLSLAAVLSLALCGCGPTSAEAGQAIVQPSAYIVAVDVSKSAKEIEEELFKTAVDHMEGMPRGTRLLVYRFDSVAQEIYDDQTIVDAEFAGRMLAPEMKNRTSNTSGTNLARLFDRIDRRLPEFAGLVSVSVFTDCGTEEMTREDDARVRELTKKWAQAGNVELVFHGVSSGHREKLRSIVEMPIQIK